MPPRAKFTKEEILDAAFALVREEGLSALTARALGAKLGSSARPIFTVFASMEQVRGEVIARARRAYDAYIARGLAQEKAFQGVGANYIRFAIDEPKLFQMLFMSEQDAVPTISTVLPKIDENYERILASVQSDYGVSPDAARALYRHLWVYSHGIAALCATKMCSFTPQEIEKMMSQVFVGLWKTQEGL